MQQKSKDGANYKKNQIYNFTKNHKQMQTHRIVLNNVKTVLPGALSRPKKLAPAPAKNAELRTTPEFCVC